MLHSAKEHIEEIPVSVVIPTYNAGIKFKNVAEMILKQRANIKKVFVIDSTSTDQTVNIADKYGFEVELIPKKNFGHGKTRQYALEKIDTEIVVFMTQDALLFDEFSIKRLVNCLISDNNIAAVFGRQIPYKNVNLYEKIFREYNYPNISFINNFDDINKSEIKAVFFSNTFSAYKRTLLLKIGGFPTNVNFGEDMYVAAKFLINGYKTAYCAEAKVYHSHNYSLLDEYERGKKIGEFQKNNTWILEKFGKPERRGLNLLTYIIKKNNLLITNAVVRCSVKYLGYIIGKFL